MSTAGPLPGTLGPLWGAVWGLPATAGGCAGSPSHLVGGLAEVEGPIRPAVPEVGGPKASGLLLPCLHRQPGTCTPSQHFHGTTAITSAISRHMTMLQDS